MPVVAAVALAGVFVGPVSASPSQRAVVAGSVPSWATASNFKQSAASTDSVGFRVYLGWQDQAGLEALARAVSTPGSASYGQFVSATQFRQRFAPSQADVNAVRAWLTSQGFNVVYVPANNHYVSVEGTLAQAAAAFGTSFAYYDVQGMSLRAPAAALTVPASIASTVTAVVGLDQSDQLVHTNVAGRGEPDAPPSPAFVNAGPCSAYWAEKTGPEFTNPYGKGALPWAPCGYTPQQIKGAYGVPGTYDGSGQTVAVIDAYASPTIVEDVNRWSINRGLPPLKPNQFTQVVAPGTYRHPEGGLKQNPQAWYGEETLDIEAVHGMAPGANIVYVGAPNNFQDLDAALNHVVDRQLAQIVTNSYGFSTELLPAGFIKAYEDTILQGVAEGIGIYFSSGDNSDESLVVGYQTADWPASSPYVTAVGGTSLAVGASNTSLFETAWGTTRTRWDTGCAPTPTWCPTAPGTWIYGSGGGVSQVFAEPSYQVGIVQPGVFSAQGRAGRAVPDVAALGDPNTGYLIGQTQTFPDGSTRYSEYRIGGTSLSSPLFAGIMALADQAAGHAHGFSNPIFYSLAGSGAFTDIRAPSATVAVLRSDFVNAVDGATTTSLRTTNQTLSLKATPGYDDVTGLGTPASGFIAALRTK